MLLGFNVERGMDISPVDYVQRILSDAIHKKVSDVHFEPQENCYQIRFRLDGFLYLIANPSSDFANRIIARIKIMADIDIAERRIPQDGRFKIVVSKIQTIDCRVSTCPMLHGEKIVVRLLDSNAHVFNIDALGFVGTQKQIFLNAIKKPHGLILVTGPTGSGKTFTLYSALNILNTPQVNISSVEDPIEIHLPGINQVNVNAKAGLNFSTVLRAFLRQDPDIIMVGEMRDLETAEIGIKAAQTGHLVLSTLHTNNAIEALTRLLNMGIPVYNIVSSLTLIIAQRLVRRLCEYCKHVVDISPKILNQENIFDGDSKFYSASGCEHCVNGYKDRVGIFEFLFMSEKIKQIFMGGANILEIAAQAKLEGMQDLRSMGLGKVMAGITTLEEINRTVKY